MARIAYRCARLRALRSTRRRFGRVRHGATCARACGRSLGAHLTFPALLGAQVGNPNERPDLMTHFLTHMFEPQTLSWAMHDSPVGMLAWMLHRRRNWSDCGGDVNRRFTDDELLLATTLYWLERFLCELGAVLRRLVQDDLGRLGTATNLLCVHRRASPCFRKSCGRSHARLRGSTRTWCIGRRCRAADTSPRAKSRSCSCKTSGRFLQNVA